MAAPFQIPALLSDIYDAALDFTQWESVLRKLAVALDGNGAVLGISGQGGRFSAYVAPLTEPAFLTSYNAYYHRISPLMPRIKALPAGSVVTDRMVLPRSQFEKSEIYNDWILPQGLCNKLYGVLSSEPSQRIMIGVHRTKEFSGEQIETYRAIAPHLQRAMAISLKLRGLAAERSSLAGTLDRLSEGVILADAEARPLFVNKAAEALFAPGYPFRLIEGRLTASRSSDTGKLRQLVESCSGPAIAKDAGGQMQLHWEGEAPVPVVIAPTRLEICWLLPHQPVAALFVRLPQQPALPPAEMLQGRYGLTRAEAAFALEICAGDGLQAAAERRGVTLATARTHLARVFQKTGTARQAELVRLLFQT